MSSSIRNLSRVVLGLLCAVPFAGAPLSGQVENLPVLPSTERLSNTFTLPRPIRVLDINKNPQLLMGMEDGRLILAFPNMPEAAALIPIDGKGMHISLILPENYDRIVWDAQLGKHDSVIRGLESVAAPLARFLVISPLRTNFHGVFERYYRAMALAGPVDKAVDLSLEMPWHVLPAEYLSMGTQLIYRSIREGKPKSTERMLSLFYATLPEDQFAEMAFAVADALRTEGEHDLAAMVYGSLARSSDEVLRQRSLLWAGYSKAVAEETEDARAILEMLDSLNRDDENFLTYCLARGRLEIAEGNVRDGLRYLSRAMVLTGVDASFKPELYYLLTLGYRDSGMTEASDRLAREFAIFYHGNPWLKKYESETGTTAPDDIDLPDTTSIPL